MLDLVVLRTSAGITSVTKNGATAGFAPHCRLPANWVGSRSTADRGPNDASIPPHRIAEAPKAGFDIDPMKCAKALMRSLKKSYPNSSGHPGALPN